MNLGKVIKLALASLTHSLSHTHTCLALSLLLSPLITLTFQPVEFFRIALMLLVASVGPEPKEAVPRKIFDETGQLYFEFNVNGVVTTVITVVMSPEFFLSSCLDLARLFQKSSNP